MSLASSVVAAAIVLVLFAVTYNYGGTGNYSSAGSTTLPVMRPVRFWNLP